MAAQNITTVPLVSTGGVPALSYSILNDSQTTFPYAQLSIASPGGVPSLVANATDVSPGTYTAHIQVTDSVGSVTDKLVTVIVIDNLKFAILDESAAFVTSTFPYSGSVTLHPFGASGSITWSVNSSTFPTPPTIVAGVLYFTANQYGTYNVTVKGVDSVQTVVLKSFSIYVKSPYAYKLVDGQIELVYTDVTSVLAGAHNFTFRVLDNETSTVSRTYNYMLQDKLSPINLKTFSVNKYWKNTDSSIYSIPIYGSVPGLTVQSSSVQNMSNGQFYQVDATTNAVKVYGTPTVFGNLEVTFPVELVRGSTVVSSFERTYSVVSYSPTTSIGLGLTNTITTKPMIVGEFFTLNPQKVWFNSPDISRDSSLIAKTSALPEGLNLDENTGLIYGPVVSDTVKTATMQFVSSTDPSQIHGEFNINFDILSSEFSLVEQIPNGKIQVPFTGTILSSSSSNLSSASVVRGTLPPGLALGVATNTVTVTGSPTQAGYFDVWIKAVNLNGQKAYIYKRFAVEYITPLQILTASLPTISTNVPYSTTLTASGGSGIYTWTLSSGTLPTGITLNGTTGVLSGTTTDGSYSSTLTFTVTDTNSATVSKNFLLEINNALTIVTSSPLPDITRNIPYSYTLKATGGNGTYTGWTVTAGALPAGITLNSATGVISGTCSLASYNSPSLTFGVSSGVATTTKVLALKLVTVPGPLSLNTSGVGVISRGCPYNATLSVSGGVAGYEWALKDPVGNPLPTGLTLTASAADSGATAVITGKSNQVVTGYTVAISVKDSTGSSVSGSLTFTSAKSVKFTTSSLPQGRVATAYSQYLKADGCNTPLLFTHTGGTLPSGFTLNTSGLLSGTCATPYDSNLTFTVTDSQSETDTITLNLKLVSSTLQIDTSAVNSITANSPFTQTLAASGGTVHPGLYPYDWSLSPDNTNNLPVGISLNPQTGVLSGTTSEGGYSKNVIFRVMDSLNVTSDKSLLVTVTANQNVVPGPDYTNSTSHGYIGYIYDGQRGDPGLMKTSANKSFFVYVTGCNSTSKSQISVTLPSVTIGSFTGPWVEWNVVSLTGGVACIKLSGYFYGSTPGDNYLPMTIHDGASSINYNAKYKVVSGQPFTIQQGDTNELPLGVFDVSN